MVTKLEVKKTTKTTKGRGKAKAEEAPKQEMPAQAAAPTPADVDAKKLGLKMTVAQMAEGYLKHLEEIGKSNGTIFSYGIELKTAIKALGADTRVVDLTEDQVREYFLSDKVTKNRKGEPKSKHTVNKTRRVLRLALKWTEALGILQKAPVPDMKDAAAE